jgi:hypothetical protein
MILHICVGFKKTCRGIGPVFNTIHLPFLGKTEAYLEAIRKNIEWLKKHNKKGNKEGRYSVQLYMANFTHLPGTHCVTSPIDRGTGLKSPLHPKRFLLPLRC